MLARSAGHVKGPVPPLRLRLDIPFHGHHDPTWSCTLPIRAWTASTLRYGGERGPVIGTFIPGFLQNLPMAWRVSSSGEVYVPVWGHRTLAYWAWACPRRS
jgi:hypothetical protein